jgi:hypothetical protein
MGQEALAGEFVRENSRKVADVMMREADLRSASKG